MHVVVDLRKGSSNQWPHDYMIKSCWSSFCVLCSELPAAAAWPQPARRHHQVRIHGQEGDQQTAQTEGEEERVDASGGGESLKDEPRHKMEGGRKLFWRKERGGRNVKEPPAFLVSATEEDTLLFLFFTHLDKFNFSSHSDISTPLYLGFLLNLPAMHAVTTWRLPDIVTRSYTHTHLLPCHLHKVEIFLLFLSLSVLHFKMSVMLLSHSLDLDKVTTEQFL